MKILKKLYKCCRCMGYSVQISPICTTAADVWLWKCLKSALCVKSPIKIYNCCRCVDWTASAALCANICKIYVQICNLWNPPERGSTAADVWSGLMFKSLQGLCANLQFVKPPERCSTAADVWIELLLLHYVQISTWTTICANLQFVKSSRKMFNCCRCVGLNSSSQLLW